MNIIKQLVSFSDEQLIMELNRRGGLVGVGDVVTKTPGLFWAQTNEKGRGVFASHDISAGEIVELSPVLIIEPQHTSRIDGMVLEDYVFIWKPEGGEVSLAVALGFGSLFNHSFQPNIVYHRQFERRLIEFKALRDIAAGEEVVVNYNRDPNDLTPIWFDMAAE